MKYINLVGIRNCITDKIVCWCDSTIVAREKVKELGIIEYNFHYKQVKIYENCDLTYPLPERICRLMYRPQYGTVTGERVEKKLVTGENEEGARICSDGWVYFCSYRSLEDCYSMLEAFKKRFADRKFEHGKDNCISRSELIK